jgi:hypothetical protein
MRIEFVVQLVSFAVMPAYTQTLMQDRLLPSDIAALNSQEDRQDLPCTVQPINPKLGFDLNFHGGFAVDLPVRQLSLFGPLTVIFRVSSEDGHGEPTYFSQQWKINPVGDDAMGVVEIQGRFVLGPGKYQVAWLMRDRAERFCSARWRASADFHGKDRKIQTSLPSGTVQSEKTELFENEVVRRDGSRGLRVLVLIHVSPRMKGPFETRSEEALATISILRHIAREPHIGAFSIVAFNLERNQILYHVPISSQVDFPALGKAIKRLNSNTIDFHCLQGYSSTQILGEVIRGEMTNQPDAVIFVGPRTTDDRPISRVSSIELKTPPFPVFYLDYVPLPDTFLAVRAPMASLSRDPIGRMVRRWKGYEFTISKPRDLFTAWNEVMARISNTRSGTAVMASN